MRRAVALGKWVDDLFCFLCIADLRGAWGVKVGMWILCHALVRLKLLLIIRLRSEGVGSIVTRGPAAQTSLLLRGPWEGA